MEIALSCAVYCNRAIRVNSILSVEKVRNCFRERLLQA